MRKNYIVNNNPKVSRITSMGFLNAHDLTLLLTGTGKNQNFSIHPFVERYIKTCTNRQGRLENHLACDYANSERDVSPNFKYSYNCFKLRLYL